MLHLSSVGVYYSIPPAELTYSYEYSQPEEIEKLLENEIKEWEEKE
jgi:hypothetical protein